MKNARRKIDIREVILTSPLGAVPRELEAVPPAGYYDIAVTGHWSEEELEIVSESLSRVIRAHIDDETTILAHVSGGYLEVCRRSESDLDRAFEYTKGERPTSSGALDSLSHRLEQIGGSKQTASALEPVRLVLAYQFGNQPSEAMVESPTRVVRRRSNTLVERDGELIAKLNPYNGLYIPGPAGDVILASHEAYCVDVDFELEKKVLYCPGVVSADKSIRPGDEVVIRRNGSVVGQGRSMLSGDSMIRSDRGKAVILRELVKPDGRPHA